MWDWERASVPYRPIYRRRLLRKRVLTLLIVALVAVPYYLYHHQRAVEPVGARVFDQVVSTVAVRYFDRDYHGVAWRGVAERYRSSVVNARTVQARYAALRSMIALLHDSHTAVYSPDDLQPRRDERHHEVFGMSPDATADGPSVDWRTIKPGIGYLRIASFPDAMNDVVAWAMSDLARDRALILDLRGNPGGLVDSVDEVAGVFLPQGTLISSGTRRYHFFGPQEFRATGDSLARFSGRLVVLIDSQTRSGAESLARALQYYHRATLVGTRSAGKVLGVDAEIPLDDGGLLRVATLDMRDPSGQRLEQRGVIPDVPTSHDALQLSVALIDSDESNNATVPSPAAPSCPIALTKLWLDGTDQKRGYARYAVTFRDNGSDKYAVRLAPEGAQAPDPSSILIRYVDANNLSDSFMWPEKGLSGLRLVTVNDLVAGTSVDCDTTLAVSGPASSRHATSDFDYGRLSFPSEVVATTLHDSTFVHEVAPTFDPTSGRTGIVWVEVTIGQSGALLDARIWKTTEISFNGRALRAAQASTYTEPEVDGRPATRSYLIEYLFGMTSEQVSGLQP